MSPRKKPKFSVSASRTKNPKTTLLMFMRCAPVRDSWRHYARRPHLPLSVVGRIELLLALRRAGVGRVGVLVQAVQDPGDDQAAEHHGQDETEGAEQVDQGVIALGHGRGSGSGRIEACSLSKAVPPAQFDRNGITSRSPGATTTSRTIRSSAARIRWTCRPGATACGS